MLKVAAYADALSKNIEGSLCGPCVLIVERHFIVDPVANGLHTTPARLDLSEQFKGNAGESIHLAVPAIEQKWEHFVRQIADGLLSSGPVELIWNSGFSNERGIEKPQLPLRSDESRTTIPETVDIMRDFESWFGLQLV